MKKYFSIAKMTILEKLQYFLSNFSSLVMVLMFIYIFLQLWKNIYQGDELIGGYTLNQMIWYVAITEILWQTIRPRRMSKELSKDIRSGKIAYILNKPINYCLYELFKYIGEAVIGILFFLVFGLPIIYLIVGPLETFSFISLIPIFVTLILSILITGIIYIAISLSAFWLGENKPIFWIYEKLVLIIGTIFPVEVFNLSIQKLIKLTPIYPTIYAVAKLVVDFSWGKFLELFIVQIIYLGIVSLICMIIYKKGVKKLNVNGG